MKNKKKLHIKKSQCSEYTDKLDSYKEHNDVNLDVNMCSSSPESDTYIVSFSSCETDKVITVTTELNPSFSTCRILNCLLRSPSCCICDESFYNCNCDLPNTPPEPKRKPKHIPSPTSDYIDNTIFNEDNNITNNTIMIPNDNIYEIVLDPSDIITDNDFDTAPSNPSSRSDNNTTTSTSEDPMITPSSIDCNDARSKHKNSKINKVIASSNYSDNLDNINLNQHNDISDDILDIPNLSSNTSKSEDNSAMNTTLILPLLSILIDYFLKYYDNNNSTENNENRHDKRDKHSKQHKSSNHHKHHKHSKNHRSSNHHKHHKHSKNHRSSKHHKHDKHSKHDR